MSKNYCKIPEGDIIKYAKFLGVSSQLVAEKANSWQRQNNTTRIPTMNELKKYCINENSLTKQNVDKVERAITLWETEETKSQKEQDKKKAQNIRISGQKGYRGANAIWLYMAKQYGIPSENIEAVNEDIWDTLTFEEQSELDRLYKRAMDSSNLNRNYLNLNTNEPGKKKAAKLHRLKVLQVMNSDAVFVIGEIVEPGQTKTIPLFEGDKEFYENKGKHSAVAGADGISVQIAINMGKPVHVFDSKDNKWKTWKDGKFVEEDTPKLTNSPLLLGRKGDISKDSMAESIGEENFKAILSVFNKTFNKKIHNVNKLSFKGLDITELSPARQEIAELAKNYKPTTEGLEVSTTNPMARLNIELNPQERKDRVEMLARNFSFTVDILIEEELSSIEEKVNVALKEMLKAKQTGNKTLIKNKIKAYNSWNSYYLKLQDPEKQRRAVINHIGLDGIFTRMKEDLKEVLEGEDSDTTKDKYLRILNNFDLLIADALEKVQYFENFRVIPVKSVNSNKFEGKATDSQENELNNTLEFEDDELGTRVSGNEGWSFKIRFVDPKMTLSMLTKRVLNNIPMLKYYSSTEENESSVETNDNYSRDDLGNIRYMNGEFAHAILINELSEMIDADDFCIKHIVDGEIQYEFPALEKVKVKYPWVENVIEALKADDNLVGAFFHDFNKAYIQYVKMDAKGVSMPLNQPTALNSALTTLLRNYENAIILSSNSVYGTSGVINRDNAKVLLNELNSIRDSLDRISFDTEDVYYNNGDLRKDSEVYEVSSTINNIIRALGFESNVDYIARNLKSLQEEDYKGEVKINTLFNNINTILSMIADPKKKGKGRKVFTDNDNYIMFFASEFKKIANIVGEVSELDNIQSFRDGENTRYSYSAPNYIINVVKKIRSNERRSKYLQSEFMYDSFFYKNGKWRNKWLEDLSKDTDEGEYLRRYLELSEVIAVTGVDSLGNEVNIPYADWTNTQTYDVLLSKYFSRESKESNLQLADYNMPIFSDSPVCMFITGRRYTTSNGKTFKEQLLPLFREVIKQEMSRIKKVLNRESLRKKAQEEGRPLDSSLEEIQNYDDKGKKFTFFPELNNLTLNNSKTFEEVAKEAINSGDIDSLNSIIDSSIEAVMDNLFSNFLSEIDVKYYTSKFKEWGVLSKSDSDDKTLSALEEYFWNSTFATSQIIEITTSDIAFYKGAVDFQKRFKQVYASGNRLNTNTKYGRKIENTIYIADQFTTTSRYDRVKASLERAVREGRMKEKHKDWILGELKNINIADAQAFRNPYSFRAVLDMMGKWNEEMEESFQRMINNQWDEKDFAIVWQTLKPFMFTNIPTEDGLGGLTRTPHQNKNSEFLILAFYDMISADSSKSEFLRGIGNFFSKHPEIDVIQFESAVKAGGQGIIDLQYNSNVVEAILYGDNNESNSILEAAKKALKGKFDTSNNNIRMKAGLDYLLDSNNITMNRYNELLEAAEIDEDAIVDTLENYIVDNNGNYDLDSGNYNKSVIHRLPYSDYMIAQPTPEHLVDIDEATAGSQFRNLILANITDPNFSITLKLSEGKTVTLNKAQMIDVYRGAITDNLLDSFEEVKDMFKDIHKLQRHLFQIIQGNPKFGSDIIEALQIVKIQDPLDPSKTREVFNLPLDLPTISNQVQELLTSVFKNKVTKQKIKGGNCIQVASVGLSRKLNVLRDANDNIIGAECMLPAWSKKFYAPFLKEYEAENGSTYAELDIEEMKEKAPDLLKMIGYRIPTENKYSMLPLIVKGFLPQQNGSSIMLPADITLIAGSDFDVDKMFLRIPAFKINDEGIPEKIMYDLPSKSNIDTASLTKEQRDNLMIDIEYAVLTSKEGSEQVFRPGNFNTLKKYARVLRVLSDSKLLNSFVQYMHPTLSQEEIDVINNDPSQLLSIFRDDKVTAKVLDKFIEEVTPSINPLVPTSYVYFHKQNMVGAALIGMYANGSSVHTKAQESNLTISDGNEFTINGKTLKSMHEILNADGDYIQDLIAEFQGASVDNAKDPVLADLGQSMTTAGTTLFMLRAGMNIEEVSLMFNVTKHYFNRFGFNQKYKLIFNKTPDNKELSTTSEEMILASMYINKYPKLYSTFMSRSKESVEQFYDAIAYYKLTEDEVKNIMKTINNVQAVYEHIVSLKTALKPANDIMKADSPNNAIAIGFPGAIRQRREVDRVNINMDSSLFPFRGVSKDAYRTKDEFISNGLVTVNMPREEMREVLLSRTLPTIQSFYSLGIELPIYTMGEYLIQGSEELGLGSTSLPGVLGRIMMNSETGNMSEIQIRDFYREFMQFVLTTTDLFGKDFNTKRQYYLTEFPLKARTLIRTIPELQKNPVVSRLKIALRNTGEFSNILYERSGKLTPIMKATIRRGLNMLLYSDNPKVVEFGKDLFMYSFYYNGFNFGPNSFGTFFDATFWNCFPEVISKLRTFKYDTRNIKELFENFMQQYLANHSDDSKDYIIKLYNSKDNPPIFNSDGTVGLRAGNCYNRYNYSYNDYMRVQVAANEYKLYALDKSNIKDFMKPDTILNYIPVPVFDEYLPVYNAQSNVEDMVNIYYNDRKRTIREKEKEDLEISKSINSKLGKSNPNIVEDPSTPVFNSLPAYTGNTMTYAGVGSRKTPKVIKDRMTEVAAKLESLGYTLNTGKVSWNDDGADQAFARGTNKKNLFGPEDANDVTRSIAKEIHPAPENLSGTGLNLMARNTYQVFGKNLDTPVDFVLYYAEPSDNPMRPKGGTGQAVEMANRKGIPTINMRDNNWEEQLDRVLNSKGNSNNFSYTESNSDSEADAPNIDDLIAKNNPEAEFENQVNKLQNIDSLSEEQENEDMRLQAIASDYDAKFNNYGEIQSYNSEAINQAEQATEAYLRSKAQLSGKSEEELISALNQIIEDKNKEQGKC